MSFTSTNHVYKWRPTWGLGNRRKGQWTVITNVISDRDRMRIGIGLPLESGSIFFWYRDQVQRDRVWTTRSDNVNNEQLIADIFKQFLEDSNQWSIIVITLLISLNLKLFWIFFAYELLFFIVYKWCLIVWLVLNFIFSFCMLWCTVFQNNELLVITTLMEWQLFERTEVEELTKEVEVFNPLTLLIILDIKTVRHLTW